MKELYQKLLYIPKHGKVPERTMLIRIGISIGFILMCLAAMSLSAYAFFSSSVTSAQSVIQSAIYDLEVISTELEENDGEYILINPLENEVKRFTFTIQPTEESNATVGYAKIVLKTQSNERTIFTAPIWTDPDVDKPAARTFSVDVAPGDSLAMTVTSQWGSCSSETVAESGALIDLSHLTIDPNEEENSEGNQGETHDTPTEDQTETPSTDSTPPADSTTPDPQPDQSQSTPPADPETGDDESSDDPSADQPTTDDPVVDETEQEDPAEQDPAAEDPVTE